MTAYRVHDEIVNEPNDCNTSPLFPVALEDEPVRRRAPDNRVLLVVRGLGHVESPDEDQNGWNHAEAEGYPPHCAQVVLAAASGQE